VATAVRSVSSAVPTVIDLRDRPGDATTTALVVDIDRIRRYRIGALVALVVLNVIDLVMTRRFLADHAGDANPLARLMVGQGLMPWAKGGLLLALGSVVLRSKPKISSTCAMWFVVGVYCTALSVNAMVLLGS
jgi:hypothetical protein